jgi:hypothetical protein
MSKKKLSKLLALYLPYVVIGLVATNLGEAWRLAVGKELGDKIVSLMDTLPAVFSNPLPSLHPFDLFIGLCCGAGMRLAVQFICVVKTPRSTATAWSTALPGGADPKISSRLWLRSLRTISF